jgi:two-component system, sensor histidine kinase and response regulator
MTPVAPVILNVDDYTPGRYARTKLLKQMGFPVVEAGTGNEALEMIEKHRPALVLLDVNLPDVSGIEVCRRIRENPETATTTVLHISASSVLTQHQVLGLDSGADGYIVEPVEPAVLLATVNAFLRARRAEDALRQSTEELRWFAHRVAHDLREPLRTITVYAELLMQCYQGDENSDNAKYLDFIAHAGSRMHSFIDGLLEYSQVTDAQNETTEIDCETIVARVVANLDAAIQESGALITHTPLPAVAADVRLEYVFQNLISNAIKYRREGVPPKIHVSASQENGEWLFSICDNGIGIEPEYLNSVFEIFRRLHGHEVPGNGIGLALSRKIVEGNGGKIWIESRPGCGSTFYFTLPLRTKSDLKR